VAEASGAPLAGVLHRFAGALDQDIDAAAQRETALAGPRATVRVLVWLPAVGVLLGFLMGSDPVRVLTGGPLGWLLTAGGTALIVVGRCWSAVLLGRAESV
jgi:tight adherence protein B